MSVKFVVSNQVTSVNAQDFGYPNNPNGITKQIPCENVEMVNSFWRVPRILGNRVIGYEYLVATDANKPTPDSVKIQRVKDTSDNSQYDFAIIDADNVATTDPQNRFAYLCDGLGGTLAVMPTVTIPYPILQQGPSSTGSTGTNVFTFSFPNNPLGLLYAIPYPWFNGIAPATPYAPSGITTAAQFVTWANTSGHWDGYGTWSSPSANIVLLSSPTTATIPVSLAGIDIALTPKAYCFDFSAYSTPAAVNQFRIGTTGALIPIPPFMLTNTNEAVVIGAIDQYLPGATFITSVANKLGVTAVSDVPKLYNNGVLVVTATAGVCS